MNLSFAGCGFLGIYHVGVAVCFRKFAPHLLLDNISGASAGAISACCMLCDLPLGEITSDLLRVVREARSGSLGPFSPSFNVHNVLLEGLEKVLPDDAHLRVSGKLHISLTRVYDGKNVIISHFQNKEDLVQALLASCFIPVFSGVLPPKFHGIRYMDGGFSDNLPILDENTITVSPFCGESDICPRDRSSQLFHVNFANTSIELSRQNIGRFTRILFPPPPEVLSNMCKQGFDDALRFLHRNNLISCTRCLAVQSTFHIQDSFEESMDFDPECTECKHHRQEALMANLPETVMSVLQGAIDSANNGLYNWIFRHRSMKVLSLLALPCTLPVDIMYATVNNIIGLSYEVHGFRYKLVKNVVMDSKGFIESLSVYKRLASLRPKVNLSIVDITRAIIQQAQEEAWVDENEPNKPPLEQYIPRHSHSSVSQLGNVEDDIIENVVIDIDSALGDDTFEQILRVTNRHEAIMAYYYMDENNKMKVTEIYDVTDAEVEALQTQSERYDSEWGNDQICDNELEGVSDISLEDVINEKNNILSDPESEWGHNKSLEFFSNSEDSDRPESDQPHSKFIPCQLYDSH